MTQRQTVERDTEQTLLGAAWRFRLLVIAFAVIGAGLAFLAASATKTTQYEATASLVVTDPRQSTLFSVDQTPQDEGIYVEDQIAILRSDTVMQLTSDMVAAEAEIEIDPIELTEETDISTSVGNEILIKYLAGSEEVAIIVVNGVITAYGDVREEAAAQDSASAVAQLERSILAIDAEVASIESQINELQQSSVQGQLDAQYDAALQRMITLQVQLGVASEEDVPGIRAELADIDAQLNRLVQVSGIERASPELVRLFEEQTRAIDRRSTLASQRDQLLVDTELLSGGIGLASPARFAAEKTTNVMMITALGGLLGLLVGAGFAYLLALRRRKLGSGAQPGMVLGTSMLAEIPVFGDEGLRSELPVLDFPASASAEAFRFAATTLEIPSRRSSRADLVTPQANTYLVTSAGPSEGKTVVAANIALAAARRGRRVLAIDADFGNQRLTELIYEEIPDVAGIAEVIEDGVPLTAAILPVHVPEGLFTMSRGRKATSPSDLLSRVETQELFKKLGEQYDVVIIDGPPMLHVAYASVLAQLADQIVVVTRHHGSVTRLEDLAQRLDIVGAPLAGYIYNAAPIRYEMTRAAGSLANVLGEKPSSV